MKKAIRTTDASLNYKQEMAKAELKIFGKSHEGKLLDELVSMLTQFMEKFADKVVIIPISSGQFSLEFQKEEFFDYPIADFKVTNQGVLKCSPFHMGELMQTELEHGVRAHNEALFAYAMLDAELNPEADSHKVEVDKVRRTWNPYGKVVEKTIVLEGTIEQIFDEFTTINDRLKYCNDDWYEWHNESMSKLYRIFIDKYKGNFFLDNAVRRGVIID